MPTFSPDFNYIDESRFSVVKKIKHWCSRDILFTVCRRYNYMSRFLYFQCWHIIIPQMMNFIKNDFQLLLFHSSFFRETRISIMKSREHWITRLQYLVFGGSTIQWEKTGPTPLPSIFPRQAFWRPKHIYYEREAIICRLPFSEWCFPAHFKLDNSSRCDYQLSWKWTRIPNADAQSRLLSLTSNTINPLQDDNC